MTRVLVVDDKPENVYILRVLLEGRGYSVDEAADGAEALTKAVETPPDLIVADLLMPVMDGFTLLRHWKAEDQLRAIPFVVHTATYTEAQDRRLAMNLGADEFILKEVEPATLLDRIAAVLSRKAHGEPARAQPSEVSEAALLTDYSAVIVRKLEQKAREQDLSNRALQEDIEKRKRVEAELRASEERFRSLADAMPQIVWVARPDGRPDFFNRKWYDYTGLAPEQNDPAVWWNDVCYPDDQKRTLDRWGHSMATGEPFETEYRLRRWDGEYRWFLGRGLAQRDEQGNIVHWYGTSTDIDDFKRAERTLQLRDRAIGAATQGIVITTPEWPANEIVYASPGFERMTGYPAAEVVGRNLRLLHGPDTDPTAAARIDEAIRAGKAATVELLHYRKDGSSFWDELSISPVRDAQGTLTHFVGVQSDVTSRRRLEEQFRHAQKMDAIGRLASGVAHDFNNLLTVINGYSDLLLQTLPQGDASRELVAEIHKAGERSAGLTRQLLMFSRQQVLAPRMLDLNAVVKDTEKMLRRLIGEDVKLVVALAPDLGLVRADPGQIEQVLMNLAVNARDAMPHGGQLTIETRAVQLDEEHRRDHPEALVGPHVVLSVSDTGCGMTPDVKAKVFEPFFTTKEPGKGTGLGLATVYGIVAQSGGHVTVASDAGQGAKFEVYLPRAEPAPERRKSRSRMDSLPRGDETILLVEDEAGVRALTVRILAQCGYRVLSAGDGAEALRVVEAHPEPIQLLITDVVMPGVGGRVVAEQVSQRHAGVKVLFISGYTDDAIVRHGVLTEGIEFLQKPFSPLALAVKVREILDRA